MVATLLLAVSAVGSRQAAWAYSPEHPVVQEMVANAIGYLEKVTAEDAIRAGYTQAGTRMLLAYAHYKVSGEANNPVVDQGVDAAVEFIRQIQGRGVPTGPTKSIYELSVAALLLASVDAVTYRSQLEQIQQMLYAEQFSHGGWGYKGEKQGDVSQTQYALLALWTLDHVGVKLDYERVKRAVAWLLRVQDVSGGWPYHGDDPGPGRPLQRQRDVSMSMALAGGSSVLIAADALRVWGDTKTGKAADVPGLPKALKVHQEDAFRGSRAQVPKEPILRAIKLCEQYQLDQPYQRPGRPDWYYYQLYTRERYESFIEIAEGRQDENPAWYDAIVEQLREDQNAETGAFGQVQRSHTGDQVSTAFSILFLIRSTQKAIGSIGTGQTRGGRELPSDTTEIVVEGTQIKGRPVAAAVTDLLDILEEDGANDLDQTSLPEDLELASDPDQRSAQLDRLERLVRGSQSWQARRVAARLLGKSDQQRVVPSLIYALSDDDVYVRRYARDGLRFISRKFDGFGMPDEPTNDQLRDAQRNWRNWYRTIDPTHVFLDYDL